MKRRLSLLGCRPIVVNEPDSEADLKKLKAFEFKNWVMNTIFATQAPKSVVNSGIDGYWFFTNDPICVKQVGHVDRPVVDRFETALRRVDQSTGYVIAFGFSRAARAEAARAKSDGLDIRLLTVAELLLMRKRPHARFGPQPKDQAEALMMHMPKKEELPSLETLIESERRSRFLESA
jgi:hypothetical protein